MPSSLASAPPPASSHPWKVWLRATLRFHRALLPTLRLWSIPPPQEHPALHPYDHLSGAADAHRPPRRLFLRGKVLQLR